MYVLIFKNLIIFNLKKKKIELFIKFDVDSLLIQFTHLIFVKYSQ